MIKEYKTIEEVAGPLMLVKRVDGVKYDELGEIELPDGSIRRCRVLEVNGSDVLVQLFESSAGLNLAESRVRFAGHGVELGVSEELALRQDLIIACGGGLPLRPDCIASLKYSGVVFWRDRDPGETYDMLDVSGRPLAQQGRDAFLARYAQRAPIYESWADYVIRGADSAEAAARMILDILQREENCT